MEKIKFGKYVSLAYEIFVVGETEDVSVFQFTAKHPDNFVFGMDAAMIESFMKKIEGLTKGEAFDFTLTPEEAFGERDPQLVMTLDRNIFKNGDGVFDSEVVFPGAEVPMRTSTGQIMRGLVLAVNEKDVTMDFNHQLAGQSVRYSGEVLEVRDATPEEMAPKGGCGSCGSCGSGNCGDCGGGCDGCK